MKNTLLVTFILVLFGCQTVRIEKRLHGKGYAVFLKKNISGKKGDAETVKLEPVEKQKNALTFNEPGKSIAVSAVDTTFSESVSPLQEIPENQRDSEVSSTTGIEDPPIEHETLDHLHKNTSQKTDLPSSGSDDSKWLLLSFAFPFLVPFLSGRKKQLSIQHWAKDNVGKARWAIAGLTFLGGGSSFFLGDFFSWHALPELIPLSLTALCGASAVYMTSNDRNIKTKALIGVTASSSLLLFACGMNDDTVYVEDTTILPWWAITLLMILTVAAVAGGVILVASLACSLACASVSGWIVFLVLYGGLFLVIFLGLLAAFNLFRRQSQRGQSFAGKAALWALGFLAFLTAASFLGLLV